LKNIYWFTSFWLFKLRHNFILYPSARIDSTIFAFKHPLSAPLRAALHPSNAPSLHPCEKCALLQASFLSTPMSYTPSFNYSLFVAL